MSLEAKNSEENSFQKIDNSFSEDSYIHQENIYKYLPIEYMFDTIANNHLIFVNPSKWKDPFDNYLFRITEGKEFTHSFIKKVFCYCLTLNPQSEAYWNAYSKEGGYAARITFSTTRLIEILKNRKEQIWIGKMEYVNEKEFIERIKSINDLKSDLFHRSLKESFLKAFKYKRNPYEYENEYRVLIYSRSTKKNLKRIKVDRSLIKEIRIDPRMGKYEALFLKNYIKDTYNINVTQSRLFKSKKIL